MPTTEGESTLGEVSRKTGETVSDGVKTAKAAGKIAANAASGNAAGAVAEGVKAAPEILRTASRLIVASLAVILLFTYAFPMSVFEATSTFFERVEEREEEYIYAGSGDVQWRTFVFNITGGKLWATLSEAAKGVWSALTGSADAADVLSPDGQTELGVMEHQNDLRDTTLNNILACSEKIKPRSEEIVKAIQSCESEINTYFQTLYAGTYDEWNGTTVSIESEPMSYYNALQLLSVYSTTKTSSNEPLKLSGYLKWLGYYDSANTGTISCDLGHSGIIVTLPAWCGEFVPAYLIEQEAYEKNTYGEDGIITDLTEYQCSILDMMFVIDTPDFNTIPAEYWTETRAAGTDPETGETEYTTVTCAAVTVPINVRLRNMTEVNNVVGFWGGDLTGDGNTTGTSEMGNIFW